MEQVLVGQSLHLLILRHLGFISTVHVTSTSVDPNTSIDSIVGESVGTEKKS